jgi:large conductance mechanosensitive channel
MLKGFRDFLMRGNVVDLAVAVIIGAAFGGVVKAFADDVIGGLIAEIGGVPDFSNEGIGKVIYGTTITALINFAIVAAVIYFVIVVPMSRFKKEKQSGPSETELLAEIRDLLAERR